MQLRQGLITQIKRNWTQELSVAILLDTLRDPGVISLMIPRFGQFFEMAINARFSEDIEFVVGDKVRDFVFEEKCVNIPTIAIDND